MKYKYIVVFDDAIEAYFNNVKDAKSEVDDMVENYCCPSLPEKTLRKDTKIYEIKEIKTNG